MKRSKPPKEIVKLRSDIASKVRELRTARRWTQAELSSRLGLSQSRLSEIEGGTGSFTAEQFLVILKIFNVGVTDFASGRADHTLELQNALARFGALHLHESDAILPGDWIGDVTDVVRTTLVSGPPRLVTALGPVVVAQVDLINWRRLELQLAEMGFQQRLAWLVDSILDAVRRELASSSLSRQWAKRYRRAELVLGALLESATSRLRGRLLDSPDILDPEIRSHRTLKEVAASASTVSQRWGIVTSLQPDDFSLALRAARADH